MSLPDIVVDISQECDLPVDMTIDIVNKVLDAVIALGEDHKYDTSTYFYMEAINKLRQEK